MNGPRFVDIGDQTETREYEVGSERSEMGRSTKEIRCPFCRAWVTAYVWSLPNGKRCECGALFGAEGRVYHWAQEASA